MRTRPSHRTAIALACLVVASLRTLSGQTLGTVATRWEYGFSRVGAAAELPDGRVIVVDNLDGLVFIGAATGGTVTPLGRQGDGPDEYQRPWSLVRSLGDTVLVYARNRLVRVTPAGAISGSHPFGPGSLGGVVGPPGGVDRDGRIYWDRPVIRDPRTNAIERQQQFEIVRFHPGKGAVEVVATASDHAPALHDNSFHPFAQRDAWVVEPAGVVRIVRARDYSVDVVRHGQVVSSGPAIPFQPIRIEASDREAYRLARAANVPSVRFNGRGAANGRGVTVTPARLAQMREAYPDAIFPEHKPPFIEDGVFRSPSGHLWVVRSPVIGASQGDRVDILDESGRRIRELDLPSGRRLLGLEGRGIYLVHEDEDGFQYLERYSWPAGLP